MDRLPAASIDASPTMQVLAAALCRKLHAPTVRFRVMGFRGERAHASKGRFLQNRMDALSDG